MYQIGVDIGGTNIKIGLVDDALEIVERRSIRFPHDGPRSVADKLAEAIREVLTAAQVPETVLQSIGIVVPGSIDPTGEIVINAYNLGFHDVPFKKLMEAHFPNVPVLMANDANGAALAELYKGAFAGCRTAVLFTLGTGLGGGIILNGKMFNGGMNHGVELGHAYLVDEGEACTCGNRGCVESYCAASALARDGARAMQDDPSGMMMEKTGGNAALVDAKLVVDCAKAGDVTAKRVFDVYVGRLSSACASIFNTLDPEVLAIGGGLCGAGEFLFAPLRKLVDEKCFYKKNHGPVVPAVMGNDAGIVGAAMLRRDADA